MELPLQNGFNNFVNTITKTKPASEIPLIVSNGTTIHVNLLPETHEDLGNMDPSRAFVSKVKRLIVKVPPSCSSPFVFVSIFLSEDCKNNSK